MSAARSLHPSTLAAHLKRKGFERAAMLTGVRCVKEGFLVALHHGRSGEGDGVSLLWRENHDALFSPVVRRLQLEKMIAALAPEFEVAEDLGHRVVVRRAAPTGAEAG